jgi:hypothetical protein
LTSTSFHYLTSCFSHDYGYWGTISDDIRNNEIGQLVDRIPSK